MSALLVLADANILVKDLVSNVLFDLAKAKLIDLRWTPQIETEYAKHRARLRAETNHRDLDFDDLICRSLAARQCLCRSCLMIYSNLFVCIQ